MGQTPFPSPAPSYLPPRLGVGSTHCLEMINKETGGIGMRGGVIVMPCMLMRDLSIFNIFFYCTTLNLIFQFCEVPMCGVTVVALGVP